MLTYTSSHNSQRNIITFAFENRNGNLHVQGQGPQRCGMAQFTEALNEEGRDYLAREAEALYHQCENYVQ